jgi:hypothetical protein
LDEISKALGFAGKPTDIQGGDVESYFRAVLRLALELSLAMERIDEVTRIEIDAVVAFLRAGYLSSRVLRAY